MDYLERILKHPSLKIYISSISIRALTIAAKFGLTFFLGKEFPDAFLGEYGLFTTSILLCYFILCFSFDSYGLREVITMPVDRQLSYIRNIFVFYGIAYLIVLPITFLIFHFGLLRSDLIIYFLILLFLETINQAFFALFTILQRPTIANITLFFSQGLWIIIVFLLWIITPLKFSSFESFLTAWILSSVIASFYSAYKVNQIYRNNPLDQSIDWSWIKAGLSVSLVFFLTTISYKLIEFTDRYVIELHLGTAKLGIYIFFSQIANLINTAINVAVIIILYPRLIESHLKNDMISFQMFKNKMYTRVLALGILIGIAEVVMIHPLMKFLSKESFAAEVRVLYILICSNIVMNLSFIPHYCLYAFKQDTILLKTTLSGAISSILLNFILIPLWGLPGAALASLSSFGIVLMTKSYFLKMTLAKR
ncbi:MAG: polysaccharide biosynthesis C-terminal domain-containing protein [Cyclobacteriaceae bacterium]|nr:polysaccharide biosynthesis C-terminal domain-containing protein [Cyclobacteriaceae bacterium]